MKIQKNSTTVSPFSGVSFVDNEFDKSGLSQQFSASFKKGTTWRVKMLPPFDQCFGERV